MKVTVTKFLNVRVGKPSLNAPCYQYLAPGSEIEVDGKLYKGDKDDGTYEGIDTWYKDEAGNYYWSGGIEKEKNILKPVENDQPFWWIADFGIDQIWKFAGGKGVTVIMLDSGLKKVDTLLVNQSEIVSIISNDDGTDLLGHGTSMAAIITGTTQFPGIANEVKIISVKISDTEEIAVSNLIKGLEWVKELTLQKKGNYVVNCSLALPDEEGTDKETIQSLIDDISRTSIVVAAVGNTDWQKKTIPGCLNNVISCAGLRKEDNVHYRLGSNYWPGISIIAPGEFPVFSLSTYFNRKIFTQGSSHSCAYISGLISLFLSLGIKTNKQYLFTDIAKFLFESSEQWITDEKIYRELDKNKLINTFNSIRS